MSFLAMQTVIARLCVDQHFRRTFRRDAGQALQSYDLSPDEIGAVTAIDFQAVDSYAEGLVRKRMGTISKWFPLTFAALRKELPAERRLEIMNGYGYGTIRESDDIGGDWVKSESQLFTRYLNSLVEQGMLDMPYLTDLLELETTRRTMSQDPEVSASSREFVKARQVDRFDELQAHGRPLLGRHAALRRFHCNIVDLIAQVEEAPAFVRPPATPTWVMFVKKPRRPKITLQTISKPVQELLELCDGTNATADVLDRMASRYASAAIAADDVRAECRHVLEECYKAGVVTFVTGKTATTATATLQ